MSPLQDFELPHTTSAGRLAQKIARLEREIRIARRTFTPTAWEGVSYVTGWSGDLEARLVGDIVQLRGVSTRASGGYLITTLDTLYRPPSGIRIPCVILGAIGYVDIQTSGQLRFYNVAGTLQGWGDADGVAYALN